MLKSVEVNVITSNENKFKELDSIAKKYNIKLKWINLPKFEVQSDSLEEIVRSSAVIAFNMIRSPLIVEDSGLFIEALNNFPGPYTNYVRRTLGLKGILKLMEGIQNRKAYFMTALCYVDEEVIRVFTGKVVGKISESIRGDKGFGFDPIFIPDGDERTFGEMNIEEKNKYSHRGKAFEEFIKFFLTYIS
ncbi:XTP/dITP diphosphatase [Sulfurisphaera tokodaii]|uniref:dITP/XTP pyrophosphatase n=2 Tax=Sulfurisphaera tokodaii TaxID=111955 RepID=F9VMV5_SULTO|nr:XTP/dITP diphosphatase [Sulfurisphaera tokodaii]BAK54252.1 nucleoside-triphosphatase [Sulfurisphaera tokodaii str. 7]HII74956.1 XTP/dITP diphosphatase [Sulfurisphaera tokodaii]